MPPACMFRSLMMRFHWARWSPPPATTPSASPAAWALVVYGNPMEMVVAVTPGPIATDPPPVVDAPPVVPAPTPPDVPVAIAPVVPPAPTAPPLVPAPDPAAPPVVPSA